MPQGNAFTQWASMLRRLKCDQGIIEAVPLPISLCLTPVACVPCQTKDEFVMSPILICLIGVSRRTAIRGRSDTRRPHEGESNRVVFGLVGTILAVCQNGRAEAAALIRQIDPAMRRNLELTLLRIGPLDCTNVPIV